MRALLVAVTAAVVLALPASAASPPVRRPGRPRRRRTPNRARHPRAGAPALRAALDCALPGVRRRVQRQLAPHRVEAGLSRLLWPRVSGRRARDRDDHEPERVADRPRPARGRFSRANPPALPARAPPPRVSSVDRLLAGHASHLRRGRRASVSRPARARSRRSGDGTGVRHRALRLSRRGSTSAERSFRR